MDKFDICIVGAGVIGLAVAKQLACMEPKRNRSIVILERESGFGQHTSSRNSEVIHAGIYYQPGGLKARLSIRGKQLLYAHCDAHQVSYQQIGKYIVAQADQELELQRLAANAEASGVDDLRWVSRSSLQEAEPAIRASHALFSPSTGILDSHGYMQSLLHLAQNQGALFAPYTQIEAIEWHADTFTLTSAIRNKSVTEQYRFQASILVNCAGLNATAVASTISAAQHIPIPTIYFCKGDYFAYTAPSPIRHLVYPLADLHAAGLGIHATLDLSGRLRFGPDAEFIDAMQYHIDPRKAVTFAQSIASYFPAISADKLLPAYSGIRPKLVPAGKPALDFNIQDGGDFGIPGLVQLFGIESPGLTASLAIGEHVNAMVSALGS